jgi:plastocyanin
VLLAGLSTGHEIGLAVVGAVFIAYAIVCSFVAPRRWPDFPGEHGLSVFLIASLALFAAMITAVAIFGREPAEASAAGATEGKPPPAAPKTIDVTEVEFAIRLPQLSKLPDGKYTFVVKNGGKIPHDLVITGGQASGQTKTPLLQPGQSAKLVVSLAQGNYTLFCSVPGHKQAGMVAKISVG